MRIVIGLALMLSACLSVGCATHAKKTIRLDIPKVNHDFGYAFEGDGYWVVWVRSPQDLPKAMSEIGCGVCAQEPYGQTFIIKVWEGKDK